MLLRGVANGIVTSTMARDLTVRDTAASYLLLGRATEDAERLGFRFGPKGTHTSRTIMFDELNRVFAAVSPGANRSDYASAIIEGNCLAKPTASTRRLTNQRLGELYALNPGVPIFRVLRRLWDLDTRGRRLLALECALARDPLLAATAPVIIELTAGSEFLRGSVKGALRAVVGDRLNENVLNKVARNTASSWTQTGHLKGRTLKRRYAVEPTPANAAFAAYLAYASGFRGAEVFASGWFAVLDCSPSSARELALEAKRLSLLDLRMSGDVVDLSLDRLDPGGVRF